MTVSYDTNGNLNAVSTGSLQPPTIVAPPHDQAVRQGSWASFSVVVADAAAVTFQWSFNGVTLPAATGDSLIIDNVTAARAGNYTVTVTNPLGSITSSAATLTIDDGNLPTPPPGPQLVTYADPDGSVTISPTKRNYTAGEAVTLTASASSGASFIGWESLGVGRLDTTNPLTVTLTADLTVRAHFVSVPVPIPPGLVSFWRGDATVADVISNHNGRFFAGLSPCPANVSTHGKVSDAFEFDGASTYVQVTDSADLRQPALTLEAWVFPTNQTGPQTVIAHGSAQDTTDVWSLAVDGGQPKFWSHGSNLLAGAPLSVPANAWTHLAATFDGTTKRLFVNGHQVNELGNLAGWAYDTSHPVPVTIGADWSGGAPSEFFAGMLAEVSLYRRALTATEILTIAKADMAGKDVTNPYFLTDWTNPLPPVAIGASSFLDFTTVLGTPPVTFSLPDAPLPPGMQLVADGRIFGQTSLAGTYGFTVRATDSAQHATDCRFVLRVREPLTPPADLVAWWPGNVNRVTGQIDDIIGIHHLTGVSLERGSPVIPLPGLVGPAMWINEGLQTGVGYLQVTSGDDLNLTELTIEAWVYYQHTGGTGTVIAHGSNDATNKWYLGFRDGKPCFRTHNTNELFGLNEFPHATWTHLAGTFDGTTKRLYVNGSQVAQADGLPPLTYQPADPHWPTVGADSHSGPTDLFVGAIDELSLYSRALTSGEIFAIFDIGSCGKDSAAPYITSTADMSAALGVPLLTRRVSSVLGTPPVAISLTTDSSLPPGWELTAVTDPRFHGVPSAAGRFEFTVQATDAANRAGRRRCNVQVFAPAAAPAGIIGWWPGNGDGQDVTGHHPATLSPNGAGFDDGMVELAFAFDGQSGHVEIADPGGTLRPAALTIEAWVFLDTNDHGHYIASKPIGTGADAANASFAMWCVRGSLLAAVGDASGQGPILTSPAILTTGRWHHVAYTADPTAGVHAIYIDGMQVQVDTALVKRPGYDANPLLIGCTLMDFSHALFMAGRVDEFTLYDRALSYLDIESIVEAGLAGKRP